MLLACAGGLVRSGDDWRHPRLGGSVADLERIDPGLRRIDVKGATLAYRGPDGALFAWVRECRGAGSPARLASALLADWQAVAEIVASRELKGAPAVVLTASADGVEMRSVTRAGPSCSDDWLLVTRGPAPARAALLDRWVDSFEPGGEESAGG